MSRHISPNYCYNDLIAFLIFAAICSLNCDNTAATESRHPQQNTLSFLGNVCTSVALTIRPSNSTLLPQTSLNFTFRTALPHTFFLAVSDGTQFCLLYLESGRLKVVYNVKDAEIISFLSPGEIKSLNDLSKHKVYFRRLGDQFMLDIDGKKSKFVASVPLKSKTIASDAQVHIGGWCQIQNQNIITNHIQNLSSFRGCLEDIWINSVNIVNRLDEQDKLPHEAIRFGCDQMFDTGSEKPFEFNSPNSQVVFQLKFRPTSFNIHFIVKTRAKNAIIAHVKIGKDLNGYLAVHLRQGKLGVAIVGPTLLRWYSPDAFDISDGLWHRIGILIIDQNLNIQVDLQAQSILLDKTLTPKAYDAKLAFGALSETRKSDSKYQREFFEGCISDINYGYKTINWTSVLWSRFVNPTCSLQYPCAQQPCPPEELCKEISGTRYICVCAHGDAAEQCAASPNSIHPNFNRTFDAQADSADAKFRRPLEAPITIQRLQVAEGGSKRIDWTIIKVMLRDETHRRISDAYIWFYVPEEPLHGKLTMEYNEEHETVRRFNYVDIRNGRVNYTHDGSETTMDNVKLHLRIANNTRSFSPQTFGVRRSYILRIDVRNVNDPPIVNLPLGNRFKLVQNSRLSFNTSRIVVLDPDTASREVKILVSQITPRAGYFINLLLNNSTVTEFTQEDVTHGQILFVAEDPIKNAVLQLQVTDGIARADPIKFVFNVSKLQLRLVHNTGLNVLHYSSKSISSRNLSFTTNAAPDQEVDIKYHIVQKPTHGHIQLQIEENRWQIKPNFTQSQINENRVRYIHAVPVRAKHDTIRLSVSALDISASTLHDFRINFIPVSIKIFTNRFQLESKLKMIITREFLFSVTFPRPSHPNQIIYDITDPPRRGFLFKTIQPGRNRRLGLGFNFTQGEINNKQIYYELNNRYSSGINDRFKFKVNTPTVQSKPAEFRIYYTPGDSYVNLTNHTLFVPEGGTVQITQRFLWLTTRDHKSFKFKLVTATKHGEIHMKHGSSTHSLANGSFFKSYDIYADSVSYRHDDSESVSDSLHLLATPTDKSKGYVEVDFWFTFKIVLSNDNKPKWCSYIGLKDRHASIYVVKHGEKEVSPRDLLYIDDDIDFDSQNLRYIFQKYNQIHAGFYAARSPEMAITTFTQRDITDLNVLFRDYGERDFYTMTYTVTDGKHDVTGKLGVNASQGPMLQEETNTGCTVQEGKLVVINRSHMSYFTNARYSAKDIHYMIIKGPSYGTLLIKIPATVRSAEQQVDVRRFSQNDIDRGFIVFKSDKTGRSRTDDIHFKIEVGRQLYKSTKFYIVIDAIDDSLLQIVQQKSLVVSERGVAAITSLNLKATHQKYMPSAVIYSVIEGPKFGKLIRLPSKGETIENYKKQYVSTFSQFDINSKLIQYFHFGKVINETDKIVLNVTSGENDISDVVLTIKIVKNQITLYVPGSIMVRQSSDYMIDRRLLRAKSSYYDKPVFIFEVTEGPKHGWIELRREDGDGDPVSQFTSRDMHFGKVFYTHDGTTTWKDDFVVVAGLEQEPMKSEPATVNVKIQFNNHITPTLSRNKPLFTWGNGVTPITSHYLEAEDEDTPPEGITFIFTSESNHEGYITYRKSPSIPILKFTQAEVNANKIGYLPTGEKKVVKKSFIVYDGAHQTNSYTFKIFRQSTKVSFDPSEVFFVAPKTNTIITSEYLNVNLAGVLPNQITYTVKAFPKFGKLYMGGLPVARFTQTDLNLHRIEYRQTKRVQQWITKDSFTFQLTINLSKKNNRLLTNMHYFKILISFAVLDSNRIGKYILTSPVVMNSDEITLSLSHLNVTQLASTTRSELKITVLGLPKFGWLIFEDQNMTSTFSFDHRAIANGQLKYRYTGKLSNSPPDEIKLSVFPERSDIPVQKVQLPFLLKIIPPSFEKHARGLQIHTLQGDMRPIRGYPYNVSEKDFLLKHLTVPTSRIFFRVLNGPSNARFVYASDIDRTVHRFTQQEISAGLIQLIPIGPDPEGYFKLQITDGSDPQVFPIKVTINPVIMSSQTFSPVGYYQLDCRGPIGINSSHLGVASNVPIPFRSDIKYHVRKPLKHGTLSMYENRTNLKKISEFTQEDVDTGKVVYVLNTMEFGSDLFTFTVEHTRNNSTTWLDNKTELTIKIYAVPQLSQRTPTVRPGKSVKITPEMLDASELANALKKDPIFLIKEGPIHGVLRQSTVKDLAGAITSHIGILHSVTAPTSLMPGIDGLENVTAVTTSARQARSATKSESTWRFQFADLQQGYIHYVSMLPKDAVLPTTDGFTYELRVNGDVPPATARFEIHISTRIDAVTSSVGGSEVKGAGKPMKPTLPNMKVDHLVAVAAAIAVSVLAGFLIVVCKVRISLKQQKLMRRRQQPYEKSQPSPSSPSTETEQPDIVRTSLYSPSSNPNLREMMEATILGGSDRPPAVHTASLTREHSGAGLAAGKATSTLPSGYHPAGAETGLNTSQPGSPVTNQRLTTFDPRPLDPISGVPVCRVTALSLRQAAAAQHGMHSNCSSSSEAFDDPFGRYAYQYSSSASDQESRTNERAPLRPRRQQQKPSGSVRQMKLKDSQYWV